MKNFYYYSVFLFLSFGALNANAELTESEKILSGFQRAPTVESLPNEIELPTVWAAALRELSKKSLETNAAGTEYGACLNVVAKGIGGDKRQHMEAYRLLLKAKASMPDDDFAKKERELRHLIASNKNGQDTEIIWNAGEIQTGGDSQIEVKHGDFFCDGEVLSSVHTHPDTNTQDDFSMQDLGVFISNTNISDFVINSSFSTCLFIKTKAAAGISNNFFGDIITEVMPYNWEPGRYRQRLAWYAQTIGIGLYCGNLNEKMKKITSNEDSPPNVPPGFYILSAKAYLLSLERQEANPKRVTSNFRPEIDGIFWKYLTEILPKKSHYLKLHKSDLPNKSSTPNEIFRYSLSFHPIEKKVISLFEHMNSRCITEVEKGLCMSADNLWKGKPTKLYAKFSYATQDNYLVEGNDSTGFHLFFEDVKNKTIYAGQCKFFENRCIADGNGFFKDPDFEYHGEFREGKMNGDGKIIKIHPNAIYQVKMVNGEMKESKRVQ